MRPATKIGRGNADDFAVIAQIHLTLATVEALAAEDCGIECDVVAGAKASHGVANSLDDSCGFMPHDDGRATSPRASVVSMYVAAADAARLNANEQVVFSGLRLCNIDEVKLLRSEKNECL